MQTDVLTTRLTEQYGELVPPTMIATCVESAASRVPDGPDPEAAARADVEALADALRRSPSRSMTT